MKAIVFDKVGEPEDVLKLADVAPLEPSSEDVVVKVSARPIHPADLAFIRGQYRVRPQLPQAAGLEGVGTVVDAGADIGVPLGTRVAFRWPGSWAEFAVVPAERLIEVPADVPDVTACQISLNPITAWGLLERADAREGESIVLTSAASSVSNLVGTLARQRGIHVIGVVRGDASESFSRCTADEVFSSGDADLVDSIVAATRGRRAAALIDSVGGPIVPRLFGTLAAGGRVVAYGVQEREPAAITNAMLIYSNLTWYGFGIDHWLSQLCEEAAIVMRDELWSVIRSGMLPLPVASVHALDGFGEALAAHAERERAGKVLVI